MPAIAGFFTSVLYILRMSTSVPDGISFSDLESLIENAPIEIVAREVDDESSSNCELHDRVNAALEAFETVADDALTAKAAVMAIIDRMIAWHSNVSQSLIEQGEAESAIGWARDAGKFQAIYNILSTIQVADDDPTCLVK